MRLRCACGRWAPVGQTECRACAIGVDVARFLAGAPLPGPASSSPHTGAAWPTHRAARRRRREERRRRRLLAERERAASAQAKLPAPAVVA